MTSAQKAAAESLISQFAFTRLLNQDQSGRRISLLGTLKGEPAILLIERAAFPSSTDAIRRLLTLIDQPRNLGANDIYHWYLACTSHHARAAPFPPAFEHDHPPNENAAITRVDAPADLKLNLIWPCTEKHVRKYSAQRLRVVVETPEVYARWVRPYMAQQREEGRLTWVFNIIEGRTEQEDVILREHSSTSSRTRNPTSTSTLNGVDLDKTSFGTSTSTDDPQGFLLLPDLNWDRTTPSSLHLLALVERRDIWSLRDLCVAHVPWLKAMRSKIIESTVHVYSHWDIEQDELKLYVHYQPTYYHFHVHVMHVMAEATGTQSVGKAFGLDNLIGTLEGMKAAGGGEDVGMKDVDVSYYLGEESDLWKGLWEPLKEGRRVTLLDWTDS